MLTALSAWRQLKNSQNPDLCAEDQLQTCTGDKARSPRSRLDAGTVPDQEVEETLGNRKPYHCGGFELPGVDVSQEACANHTDYSYQGESNTVPPVSALTEPSYQHPDHLYSSLWQQWGVYESWSEDQKTYFISYQQWYFAHCAGSLATSADDSKASGLSALHDSLGNGALSAAASQDGCGIQTVQGLPQGIQTSGMTAGAGILPAAAATSCLPPSCAATPVKQLQASRPSDCPTAPDCTMEVAPSPSLSCPQPQECSEDDADVESHPDQQQRHPPSSVPLSSLHAARVEKPPAGRSPDTGSLDVAAVLDTQPPAPAAGLPEARPAVPAAALMPAARKPGQLPSVPSKCCIELPLTEELTPPAGPAPALPSTTPVPTTLDAQSHAIHTGPQPCSTAGGAHAILHVARSEPLYIHADKQLKHSMDEPQSSDADAHEPGPFATLSEAPAIVQLQASTLGGDRSAPPARLPPAAVSMLQGVPGIKPVAGHSMASTATAPAVPPEDVESAKVAVHPAARAAVHNDAKSAGPAASVTGPCTTQTAVAECSWQELLGMNLAEITASYGRIPSKLRADAQELPAAPAVNSSGRSGEVAIAEAAGPLQGVNPSAGAGVFGTLTQLASAATNGFCMLLDGSLQLEVAQEGQPCDSSADQRWMAAMSKVLAVIAAEDEQALAQEQGRSHPPGQAANAHIRASKQQRDPKRQTGGAHVKGSEGAMGSQVGGVAEAVPLGTGKPPRTNSLQVRLPEAQPADGFAAGIQLPAPLPLLSPAMARPNQPGPFRSQADASTLDPAVAAARRQDLGRAQSLPVEGWDAGLPREPRRARMSMHGDGAGLLLDSPRLELQAKPLSSPNVPQAEDGSMLGPDAVVMAEAVQSEKQAPLGGAPNGFTVVQELAGHAEATATPATEASSARTLQPVPALRLPVALGTMVEVPRPTPGVQPPSHLPSVGTPPDGQAGCSPSPLATPNGTPRGIHAGDTPTATPLGTPRDAPAGCPPSPLATTPLGTPHRRHHRSSTHCPPSPPSMMSNASAAAYTTPGLPMLSPRAGWQGTPPTSGYWGHSPSSWAVPDSTISQGSQVSPHSGASDVSSIASEVSSMRRQQDQLMVMQQTMLDMQREMVSQVKKGLLNIQDRLSTVESSVCSVSVPRPQSPYSPNPISYRAMPQSPEGSTANSVAHRAPARTGKAKAPPPSPTRSAIDQALEAERTKEVAIDSKSVDQITAEKAISDLLFLVSQQQQMIDALQQSRPAAV